MAEAVNILYGVVGWTWVVLVVTWAAASFTAKRTVRRQTLRSRVTQLLFVAVGALLIWGAGPWKGILRTEVIPRTVATVALAAALTVAGIGFALWARFAIGRNWSGTVTLKEDHELVRSGPYALVRHPIYSGLLVGLAGAAIARADAGAMVGLVLIGIAFHLKAQTEEQFMVAQFGERYATYRKEVKALVPFVW